jgi:hypothetical protein
LSSPRTLYEIEIKEKEILSYIKSFIYYPLASTIPLFILVGLALVESEEMIICLMNALKQ